MLVWPPPSQTLDCAPLPFLKHGLIMYLAFMFYHALGYLCIPIRKTFPYLLFIYLTVYLFIYGRGRREGGERQEKTGRGKHVCARVRLARLGESTGREWPPNPIDHMVTHGALRQAPRSVRAAFDAPPERGPSTTRMRGVGPSTARGTLCRGSLSHCPRLRSMQQTRPGQFDQYGTTRAQFGPNTSPGKRNIYAPKTAQYSPMRLPQGPQTAPKRHKKISKKPKTAQDENVSHVTALLFLLLLLLIHAITVTIIIITTIKPGDATRQMVGHP